MTEPLYEVRQIKHFKDLLEQSSKLFYDRPAFTIKENGEFSEILYPKLKSDVYAIGTSLLKQNLLTEKIAVIGLNSYEWCVSYFAVTCGAGVVVPIDKDLPLDEILNIIKISNTKAIFADDIRSKLLVDNMDKLPEDFVIINLQRDSQNQSNDWLCFSSLLQNGKELIDSGNNKFENIEVDPDVLSVLLFTSGTTGVAKGVMLSQHNICSDVMGLSQVVKIYPTDSIVSVLPLHHTYECSVNFIMMMYSGGNIFFSEGLRYMVQNMQDFKPTLFLTVPLMLEKIHKRIVKAATSKHAGRLTLSFGKAISNFGSAFGVNIKDKIFSEIQNLFGGKLRMIITGAAPINPSVVKDFQTFGIPVYIGYGLTECSPIVICNHDKLQLHDAVGTPLPGVEAKIINPDNNGIGEICVKGPMIMLGYYENPEATEQVLQDGWFHTGDLGYVDNDNVYRITGRSKNVIVTKNGKNIYPEEVEYYLNGNPIIAESMVEGKEEDDDNTETSVIAKIFPDIEAIKEKLKIQNVSHEQIVKAVSEVIKDVNKKLPRHKNIKHFDIREAEFIKTTTQKIKRYANKDHETPNENSNS